MSQLNQTLRTLSRAISAISKMSDLDDTLQQIADAARQLVGAKYAALGVPDGEGYLRRFIFSGLPADHAEQIGHLPKGLGLLGAIMKEKRPFRLANMSDDPHSVGFPEHHPTMTSFLGVPILVGDELVGNLYFADKKDGSEFSEADLEVVELLANHAAIAIQNAHLYAEVGRLAIVDERTRIGMDLHDGIIQSIYAVGLTLESAKLSLPEQAEESEVLLGVAIQGLNDTIRDIRNFILDLRPHRFTGDLEAGLARLVREFRANTMVGVDVQAEETAVTQLPPTIARTLFLTTQEALANIARHARAEQVVIKLSCPDSRCVELLITDNGRGFDTEAKDTFIGHGLSNMRTRASDLKGAFEIKSQVGQGTAVCLTLPL